jgi:hypothetical protein
LADYPTNLRGRATRCSSAGIGSCSPPGNPGPLTQSSRQTLAKALHLIDIILSDVSSLLRRRQTFGKRTIRIYIGVITSAELAEAVEFVLVGPVDPDAVLMKPPAQWMVTSTNSVCPWAMTTTPSTSPCHVAVRLRRLDALYGRRDV